MNKKIAISTVILSSLLLCACGSNTAQNTNINLNQSSPSITPMTTTISATKTTPSSDPYVGLTTKDGQIVIKLYKDQAPNTVANFLKKVNSGFYNGLTFHRVEPGFVIQGGDPLGNGTGGGNIASEINQIPFRRGSVGLARGGDRNISNDSQFYICLADQSCSSLTGDYVNFGEVVSGMNVADQVEVGDKIIKIATTTK